ncbi:MAG: DNA polymerase III subunit beta [Candidatus Abyssobacteria bacterium SURF_17]|jgi:DNA polymerase-3 subunit beta|uniref:Beta sliding clamp n=1 Tax=Candidatus Abyssobacteria bacterium SURF_17 TaxID=2093361 RepID=A0A419EXH3_9BACT|nr:MAG: DNA polymerase III subunit beta [Candidatus Abyssubacteria bacterium SURF_17]
MKLAIGRDELRDAIGKVQNVVSARSTLPMLQYVLLEAKKNSLKLVATDLEVGIECVVECESLGQEGIMTLPCKKLHEVVANLPPGSVSVSVSDGTTVALSSGVVSYKLMGMPPDEFPKSPEVSRERAFKMPQADLKDMLKRVSFSISVDPNRVNITGLLFALVDKQLRLVTTDGRRLSFALYPLESASGFEVSHIIPRKTIVELERLLGEEGDVTLYFSENQVAFEFENLLVISNLIDGVFPNYEQVIPRGHDKKVVVDKEPFAVATRRAQVMTTDRYNLVKYEITKGKMVVTTNCPEVGELKDEVEMEYDGAAVEMGFNPQFVLDVLKVIQEEKVRIELKDSQSSGLFKPMGSDNYLYVVMPVRL